jgi:TonB family protein
MLVAIASVPIVQAAEQPSQLLAGCDPKKSYGAAYPPKMIRLEIEGRVLLEVERSSKGRLRVVKVIASEPQEAFDADAKRMLSDFRCEKLPEPVTGTVSITFSLKPGPGVGHFEGADDALSISTGRIGT